MNTNKRLLSAEELSAFSAQLAITVQTGIPLSESVMILRDDSETRAAKDLLGTILDSLEAGNPLATALRETGAFPPYMTQMIEIGETSGRLDRALDSLSKYYTREYNVARSVRSAVTYPAIMLLILVSVVLILVVKVLPIFNDVFNSLGGEMSPLASGAMTLGDAVSRYSVAIIIAIAVIAIILIVMRVTQGGRKVVSSAARRIFKRLSQKMASGKFASSMALMLAGGLNTDRALDLTLPLMDNPDMRERVEKLKELVENGESFAESVVKTKVFTGMEARMLVLGFKSGNLDNVMERIAADYEAQTDERLDNLISVIEPTMVAVLCVIVGMIILSAMLPLLAVMSSVV